MLGLEKDILILISKVRCITENQFGRAFATRKRYARKSFKKTLKKMCNEYTLRKYPCNINYSGYKDSSYVYHLNGSKQYKGKELTKVIIGSEIALKASMGGYQIKRFYRNVSVGDYRYDIFLEYTDECNELKQILIDINIDDNIKSYKYTNMKEKIKESTIPFYNIPKVLVITSEDIDELTFHRLNSDECDIHFLNFKLNKLLNYL